MVLLYLFIEKYQKSQIKEFASFAKGLEKDIAAVENAVSSSKSNGFVEGTIFNFISRFSNQQKTKKPKT